jgi:hypothetical protein
MSRSLLLVLAVSCFLGACSTPTPEQLAERAKIESQRERDRLAKEREKRIAENQRKQDNWYSGGSLHKATASEWKASTDKNRLATSADFAAATLDRKIENIEELLPDAVYIERCISKAVESENLGANKIPDIATLCVLSLR